MPVQETIVDVDPNSIQRIWAPFKRSLPTPEELAEYALKKGLVDSAGVKAMRDAIDERIKGEEHGFLTILFETIWYEIKSKIKLDEETFYKLLSQADKIAGFMPNEFWRKVVIILDGVGERLLAEEQKNAGNT